MASLVALAIASQKSLSCVSPATVADVSPVTVAVQSPKSRCQELVPRQDQRLASNIVDSPSPIVLTRSSRRGISVTMNRSCMMLDCDVMLQKEVQPSPLLTNGFWCLHEICESYMVCVDDNGSSQQMLPVPLHSIHYAKDFFARDACDKA